MVAEKAQVLPVLHLVQELRHVVDEAHVQHPVRLVQDGGAGAVDAHRAALHVVLEAAGGGHHNLGTLLERVDLPADGLSAVEADHADAGLELGKVPHFRGDLHSQLPGGGQDHRLDPVGVDVDMLDDGDAEGEGLAGARGGLGGHVLPVQHGRDAPGLDGGGYLVVLFFQRAHDLRREAQRVEAHALCNFHNFVLAFSVLQLTNSVYHRKYPHASPSPAFSGKFIVFLRFAVPDFFVDFHVAPFRTRFGRYTPNV